MKKIFLLITYFTLTFNFFSQSAIRLGINFPMRAPEVSSIPVYMNLVAESGAQIVRQLTYADLLWKQIELTDNQWNFINPDSVFIADHARLHRKHPSGHRKMGAFEGGSDPKRI